MVFLKELVEQNFISSWQLKKGKQYTLLNQISLGLAMPQTKIPHRQGMGFQ